MENYSDPTVWAKYVQTHGIESSPPPPPHIYQRSSNVHRALHSWAHVRSKKRGEESDRNAAHLLACIDRGDFDHPLEERRH